MAEKLSVRDAVLSFAAREPLRAAMFLTYSFDGRWFEEAIVPDLCERPIATMLVVRDRNAISNEAPSVRYHKANARSAVFHPKLTLLVADNRQLADSPQTTHRYKAACAAALAGCGQGQDDPTPDEVAKSKLRIQSREWLAAELEVWNRLLENATPQQRQFIAQAMNHWRNNSDLAGIRDEIHLTKLAEDEQVALRNLWKGVDVLLGEAKTP